ncbi:F-box/LRR-repeat protein 20 [Camellia lanceoleosa]|uniref:F-box/LRR-repeat protein 20 n=1 Tax=Camellia lanceoleosa TaxID=1840588 RepID=A0ACC0F9G3_9ERIC|nr:F-box/LRR-repeat protein 20 [Camellia lanceoleosa]
MANNCDDLPDECWELIFNRFDHHSHLESLSLSSKKFLTIINGLRTHFTILNPTIFIHGNLSKLFHRFTHIKSIDVSSFRGNLDRVILEIAKSDLKVETLNVSKNNRLPLEGLKVLGSNMKSLRVLNCANLSKFCDIELFTIANSMLWLEELDISYPRNNLGSGFEMQRLNVAELGVTNCGIELLSLKLRDLRKINISGNPFLTNNSLVALSTNCVFLKEIEFLHCPFITHFGIEFVVRNSPNLCSVSVDGIQIPSPVYMNVIDFTFARGLSSVDIHESVISDELLHSLAKAGIPLRRFTLAYCSNFTFFGILSILSTYQSLEYLAFIDVGFLNDMHMSDICRYLCTLITIKLKLCSKLTDSTFFTLAKNCPFLKDIDMERANLGGGDGTADIVKNSRIMSLNLAYNSNLSDECLRKLASICPNVELLDVSSCLGITEKGVAEFLKGDSKIRHLHINDCRGIKNIGTGFELPKLEVLRAARSGIDDEGLAIIGNRCCRLLNFDLEGCVGATKVGLKEISTNCKILREINLNGCVNLSTVFVDWMVFSKPSLRKLVPPRLSLITESQRELFLRHGCLVCDGYSSKRYVQE